jgi:hypothetical protein
MLAFLNVLGILFTHPWLMAILHGRDGHESRSWYYLGDKWPIFVYNIHVTCVCSDVVVQAYMLMVADICCFNTPDIFRPELISINQRCFTKN